ncbi:uncharacterized protein V6R79_004339 [Siganus canaliculatus]
MSSVLYCISQRSLARKSLGTGQKKKEADTCEFFIKLSAKISDQLQLCGEVSAQRCDEGIRDKTGLIAEIQKDLTNQQMDTSNDTALHSGFSSMEMFQEEVERCCTKAADAAAEIISFIVKDVGTRLKENRTWILK